MISLPDDKMRQIIKICNYYYLDGLSQKDIADKMGISRPQISRYLTLAKASGIVNITINDPFSEERKMERWLTGTFGLVDARIVKATENDITELTAQLGGAVTDLLNISIKENSTLGIMAGTTLNRLSKQVGMLARKNLTVVPLTGGCGNEGNWQANLTAQILGERFNCNYQQLNTPMLVAAPETKTALLREPAIREVLDAGKNCTVALIGIGQMQRDATIINAGFFSRSDLEEIHDKGAVASICNSFLDLEGHVIDFSGYNRMIGVCADDLKQIPKVIAVATGASKVKAITSTLIGKWIDVLVTNLDTAKAVMDYYYSSSGAPAERGERTELFY